MDERMLLDLMNFLPISVYFKDCDGRFIMVSKQKAINAGTIPHEMIGKTDFDFMLDENAQKAWRDDQYVMQTGKPICGKIEKKIRKNGTETFSITTRAPRYNEHGGLIGVMGISHDITKMMEYEDAMRNLFLNESHNIKSPLVAANGQIGRVIRGKYGKADTKVLEILSKIHIDLSAVELHVKSSLMEIALLGFDDDLETKTSPMFSRINLRDDVIDPILYAYSNQITENQMTIHNDISESIIIRGQRSWISSVFDNVFNNSIKYGDRGCDIFLRAIHEESRIVIAISNTGDPLDDEFVEKRLFQKFQRQNDNIEGSGIGLHTSKKLMQMMNGDIYYRKTPEGHPEFCFWLPV